LSLESGLAKVSDDEEAIHWRSNFGGMSVSDAKRLKKLLADSLLENEVTLEACEKNW